MLELRDIHKVYQGQPLLRGVSLTVAPGETVCLLGASGSGKSTLLRIITGLERAEAGQVLWEGEDLASMPAHLRNFGLVFQDYALFPHLTVAGNVAFGLRMQRLPRREIRARVAAALEQVKMSAFASRQVSDLSGGEQQRVALARALATRPRLLLFDEPLGALDRSLRDHLLGELRGILRASGIPAVYVTHDQDEAFAIADKVALLHEGRIVQQGTPQEVYAHPVSAWVAEFLGLGNILAGKCLGRGRVETRLGVLETACETEAACGESVALLIRPEQVKPLEEGGRLKGRVSDVLFQKNGYRVTLDEGLFFFTQTPPQVGEEISFSVEAECLG
ncbi:MAG: ABC transporter ATP-binding protein [Anaerolineales bacterium]